MVEHHGWQVPSSFTTPAEEAARTRESVGLADVSWMCKFNLPGPCPGEHSRPGTRGVRLVAVAPAILGHVRTVGGRCG